MNDFTTPMMKQYMKIKDQYKDCLLFYRMGDFYELFLEDAKIGAQVLSITLTRKAAGKNQHVPMAGVPYHAVDAYLAKLVKAGYKVAICEQVSLPNKYGLVDREVIRIVTPGTLLDEKALNQKENNYIVSVTRESNVIAISSADISTGYFATTQTTSSNLEQSLLNELARLHPAECILPEHLYNDPSFLNILHKQSDMNISNFSHWSMYSENAEKILQEHFMVTTLAGFGITNKPLSLVSAASLLGYLQETQKTKVQHIKKIITDTTGPTMLLDRSTTINLELFATIRDHDTKGSLLSVIDETLTPMGGRLMKEWIKRPLVTKEEITARHAVVTVIVTNHDIRTELRTLLKSIHDIERTLSRLSVNIGNARDLITIKESLTTTFLIKKLLETINSEVPLVDTLKKNFSLDLHKVIDLVQTTIVDEPPIELREGGLIRGGINERLDSLRDTIYTSKSWITEFEKRERERTGIGSLKVKFNKVFGFYIEISNANLSFVPKDYTRKQTLVNGERFITEDLKKHEEIILRADEEINELEYRIFMQTVQQVLQYTAQIQEASEAIATIDCLTNFAVIAQLHNYIRPIILENGDLHITQGRHPVVETLLENNKQFVPNDVVLEKGNQSLLLITGPNMAGKSVLIRQIALIMLLNQIGSFVPAKHAELSIVDRIFVRSGASDVITSGLSTFMVEMVETAHILHYATSDSLIIMDEIGRGTSTYDGISIAWAVAEYLVKGFTQTPKTLFATHYHELQELEEEYPQEIKNYHMEVANQQGEPVFLHTLLPGGASHSFGVAVARLAGIPEEVIGKAKQLLQDLENKHSIQTPSFVPPQTLIDHMIHKELDAIDIHQMTPLEALNKLAELKDKLKMLQEDQQVLQRD